MMDKSRCTGIIVHCKSNLFFILIHLFKQPFALQIYTFEWMSSEAIVSICLGLGVLSGG